MKSQYWIQREGKTTGPFSDEQFAQMTAAGMISASDLVSTDQVQWAIAESFSGTIAQDECCPEASGQGRQSQADAAQSQPQRPQCTIHDAAAAGNIEQIKLHLSWGTDVNAADRVGQSPLCHAVRGGSLGAIELLLANGADVNSKGADDQAPLHDAVMFSRSNRIEIVELLCAMGADMNARDRWGRTPMSYAGFFGVDSAESVEIAEVLLAKGASLFADDNDYRIPLHHYASDGRTGLVEFCLRDTWYKGSQQLRINSRDNQGKTPLELAEEGSEVAALLESSGAKRSPIWYRGPLPPRVVHGLACAFLFFVGGGIWAGYFFWWGSLISIIFGFLMGYMHK